MLFRSRFAFSREISSSSSILELGIKFGDGTERVVKNFTKTGSYLVFSYGIQSNDNGGLQITYVKGTVTDTAGNTIALGIVGNENTWKNTIIADTIFDVPTKSNGSMTFSEKVYKLDGNQIRNLLPSDVSILDTSNGTTMSGTIDTIEISEDKKTITPGKRVEYEENGKKKTKFNSDPNKIIFIKDVCDIAGNTQSPSNANGHQWYVINTNGVSAQADEKYYFKEGKQITVFIIGCLYVEIYLV